jgi:predicted metal-binding membrane protein
MRNIFELTKREQRIVVVIIVALVAFAFVKHLWQTKSQAVPAATTSTPAASTALPPPKDESESDDQR